MSGYMTNEYAIANYMSQELVLISGIAKCHLKCDRFNGSIVNGNRQAMLYSFGLDKTAVCEIVRIPKAIHLKKQFFHINSYICINKIIFHFFRSEESLLLPNRN